MVLPPSQSKKVDLPEIHTEEKWRLAVISPRVWWVVLWLCYCGRRYSSCECEYYIVDHCCLI